MLSSELTFPELLIPKQEPVLLTVLVNPEIRLFEKLTTVAGPPFRKPVRGLFVEVQLTVTRLLFWMLKVEDAILVLFTPIKLPPAVMERLIPENKLD